MIAFNAKVVVRWVRSELMRSRNNTGSSLVGGGVIIGGKCVGLIIAWINPVTDIVRKLVADERCVIWDFQKRGRFCFLGVKEGFIETVEGGRRLDGDITGEIRISRCSAWVETMCSRIGGSCIKN